MKRHAALIAGTILLASINHGCGGDASNGDPAGHDAAHGSAPPTNRVAIPSAVRSNLGITFATVERRRIQDTLRVPGRFEYLPTATREYRTMLPGRIELLVEQFQPVKEGTPLYRINSPAWREIQKELAEAEMTITQLRATLLSHEDLFVAHMLQEESLLENIVIWSERVARLESLREAGGGSMRELTSARSTLAEAQTKLAELKELAAKHEVKQDQSRAALEAAMAHRELALEAAASLTGLAPGDLLVIDTTIQSAPPAWLTMTDIEVRSTAPGIVDAIDLTNGAWADARSNVVTVVQPERLRFHAFGLQSDLGVLQDGLNATIVPPAPTMTGNAIPMDQTMQGTLLLGPSGNAEDRTIDLFVTPGELADWARPGVSAQLEIVTDESSTLELAIPLAAVQRDGLLPIIFRRAPDKPNEAIRMEADLGMNDDRWVEVLSGLGEGDQVVLDGGFQLMLATSGTIQKGGHFHADGTYHEGEH
ncbi:MAG: efflux RND transporter periplasmic adaptor subunit [Phycisphaerales bacterium]|nr:efflux RND transporter periplasmic adaptor subunit [Phycisphaerales bacterium]